MHLILNGLAVLGIFTFLFLFLGATCLAADIVQLKRKIKKAKKETRNGN